MIHPQSQTLSKHIIVLQEQNTTLSAGLVWIKWSGPSPHLSPHLCSLVQFSHTSHCLASGTHTHTHRCFWVCVYVCGCVFFHMITSVGSVAVELRSSSSRSSCDPESCGFRGSKTTSGQLSSQSAFSEQQQQLKQPRHSFVSLSCQT